MKKGNNTGDSKGQSGLMVGYIERYTQRPAGRSYYTAVTQDTGRQFALSSCNGPMSLQVVEGMTCFVTSIMPNIRLANADEVIMVIGSDKDGVNHVEAWSTRSEYNRAWNIWNQSKAREASKVSGKYYRLCAVSANGRRRPITEGALERISKAFPLGSPSKLSARLGAGEMLMWLRYEVGTKDDDKAVVWSEVSDPRIQHTPVEKPVSIKAEDISVKKATSTTASTSAEPPVRVAMPASQKPKKFKETLHGLGELHL